MALTLKAHWASILNAFESRLNNGGVEAINGLIQAAKARARGYRTTTNLIAMAYLIGAQLTHLPASPTPQHLDGGRRENHRPPQNAKDRKSR